MRCLVFLVVILSHTFGNNIGETTNDNPKPISDNKYINHEFPKYDDVDLANNIIDRFSAYNENYFLPMYYSFGKINPPFKPYEVKLQFSAKVNIFEDNASGVGIFFGYTQTSFFQMYSLGISSPFRDNDYMPEIKLYKALEWEFLGGKFYNLRFGYVHRSNGEDQLKSRSIDRISTELMYRRNNFKASIITWIYLRDDPKDVSRYIGYGDLKFGYTFLNRNHINFIIHNAFHNYKQYKGSLMVEYKFDFHRMSMYAQYFQGHGDNLFQYKTKSKSLGIGIAIRR